MMKKTRRRNRIAETHGLAGFSTNTNRNDVERQGMSFVLKLVDWRRGIKLGSTGKPTQGKFWN